MAGGVIFDILVASAMCRRKRKDGEDSACVMRSNRFLRRARFKAIVVSRGQSWWSAVVVDRA